jgi:hypothetical protein
VEEEDPFMSEHEKLEKALDASRENARRVKQGIMAILNRPVTSVEITDYSRAISPGSEREAVYYSVHNLYCWRTLPGALEWLRYHIAQNKNKKTC